MRCRDPGVVDEKSVGLLGSAPTHEFSGSGRAVVAGALPTRRLERSESQVGKPIPFWGLNRIPSKAERQAAGLTRRTGFLHRPDYSPARGASFKVGFKEVEGFTWTCSRHVGQVAEFDSR
jgi:hypothetical protein